MQTIKLTFHRCKNQGIRFKLTFMKFRDCLQFFKYLKTSVLSVSKLKFWNVNVNKLQLF